MSYNSSRAQVKTTTTTSTSNYEPESGKIQETNTTTFSQIQKPTKYTESIVRIGRRGKNDTQEIITKTYQQPTRVVETKTRYDPKTGTTQKITTTGYQPQAKVVTETRRKNEPSKGTKEITTTTSKYQPSSKVVTETTKRYGPVSSSTKETTVTTTKYQPQTKVTETRTRYGTSNIPDKDGYVTVPLKVSEAKKRYGPDVKSSKQVTYITYQPGRAKPINDNNVDKKNDVFVVSEKRTEKYSNNNGNEKKCVTVEKTVDDGKKRQFRRFQASK